MISDADPDEVTNIQRKDIQPSLTKFGFKY